MAREVTRTEISDKNMASCVMYTIISITFVIVFYILKMLFFPFSDIVLLIALVGSFLSIIQICSSWRNVKKKFKTVLAFLILLVTIVPAYTVMYLLSTIKG